MKGTKTFSLGYVGMGLDSEKHAVYDFDKETLYVNDPTTYNIISLNEKERKELFLIINELEGNPLRLGE